MNCLKSLFCVWIENTLFSCGRNQNLYTTIISSNLLPCDRIGVSFMEVVFPVEVGLLTPGCLLTCAWLSPSLPFPCTRQAPLCPFILSFCSSSYHQTFLQGFLSLYLCLPAHQLGQNSSSTVPSHIQVLCLLSMQHPVLNQFRNFSVFTEAGWNSWRPKVTGDSVLQRDGKDCDSAGLTFLGI